MLLKNKMNEKGFTLMELLVVIVIISIASSIILVSYSSQKGNKNLLFSAQQLANDTRAAQNNTVNVLEFNGQIPSGGFGINISTISNTKYIIFADVDGNKSYDGGGEKVNEIDFPGGVTIDSISTTPDVGSGTVDIVFVPPFGKTYIEGVDTAAAGSVISLNIALKKSGGTCPQNCVTVTVTSEGRVIN